MNNMNKIELIEALKILRLDSDYEKSHGEADELLLRYINDEEIEEAYNALEKWYA